MRGIVTVIVVGFDALLLFGVFAPALLEPVAEVVVNNEAVANSETFGETSTSVRDGLFSTIFLWGPLMTLGAAVVFAVRWYLRREQITGRRVR